MTDYTDLIQYGALDLERAEKLFEDEDYNFAAFCAQQALEKHVKGYMIRFGIFKNVEQLGHLQYPKVIDKMINWMQHTTDESKDKKYRKYMQKNIQFYKYILKLLEEIRDKSDKKIIFWKESLNITLNKHERNISNGIESEFLKYATELQKTSSEYMMTDVFGIHEVDTTKLNEKDKEFIEKLTSMGSNLQNATKTITANQHYATKAMTELEELVEMISYGTGKDALSKEDTIKIKEFIKLQKSLEWMWTVMNSYPHVIISRYPIEIDGKDSMTLYQKNKQDVWKLIQEIKEICSDIKKFCN